MTNSGISLTAAQAQGTGYLPFVLIGKGKQTIDFGVTGNWKLVTYDWAADKGRRIINGLPINPAAVTIDFSEYPRGFCAGYLYTENGEPTTTTSTSTTSTSQSTSQTTSVSTNTTVSTSTTTLLENGPGGCGELLARALRWLGVMNGTE